MVMRRAGRASGTGTPGRKVGVPVAALTAALCLTAVLPGQATAAPADGAGSARGYGIDEDAKKIKGTPSSGDGPEMRPGVYTDSIGRGEKKYYRVELDDTSSAFISAVAAPKPGSRVRGVGEGLKIELESVDGSPCGSSQPQFRVEGAAYPIADYATRVIGADDACQKAGPYLFSVQREGPATSDPARWPLELRFMSEPGLKGGRDALPAAPGEDAGTEATAPVTKGAGRRAHGGSGFNDAGALSEGMWKDRIRPGETRFYRVPVDWGQRLNAAVELGSAGSPGEYPPSIYNGLGVTAYNAARGRFDDPPFVPYSPDKSAQAALLTPPVNYGSRFGYSNKASCVAGWHYLAVTVSPKLAPYFKPTAPLTLRVDVVGDAKAGPKYTGDAHAAGFGVSEDDREQAEKGQSAADAQRSGTLRLVAYAGIGVGVVLLLVLAVWTLAARRRSSDGPGAVPPAPGMPGVPGVPGVPGGFPGQGGHSGTVPLRQQQGTSHTPEAGSGPEEAHGRGAAQPPRP